MSIRPRRVPGNTCAPVFAVITMNHWATIVNPVTYAISFRVFVKTHLNMYSSDVVGGKGVNKQS
jgi:hypothetical protein